MSDVWPSMFGAEFGEFGALQAGRQRLFSRIYCNYFRFLERGGARGERVSVHDAAFDYRDATPYDHAHDTPTTVASDWLANELAEHGEIDAAYRDRIRGVDRELTRGCAPGPPARLQPVDKSCH